MAIIGQEKSTQPGLNLTHVFTMTVGTIIGIGWITVLGFWLGEAGTVGAMLAFILGAAMIMPIALCYAEMAASIPEKGAEVAYARVIAGPAGGFWAGWLLLLIFMSVIAFEAVSTGWVVSALFPGMGLGHIVQIAGYEVRPFETALGLGGMLLIMAVNLRGNRSFGQLQGLTTYGKIAVSAIFVTVGLVWGDARNLQPMFVGPDTQTQLSGVLAVLVTTPFWFSGFNAAAQAIGERSRDVPLRGIGITLVGAIFVSLLFYCLVIAAASMAAPRATILNHALPVAGAFESTFGPGAAKIVMLAGLLGLVSTWNAVFFAASRVVQALATEGNLPRWFAKQNVRTGSPSRAIIACGIAGGLGTLLGRAVIGPIVNTTGICVAALFLLVSVGVLILRRREPDRPRPYRVPGGKPAAACAAIFSLVLVCLSIFIPFVETKGPVPLEWVILGCWILLGGVVKLTSKARRVRG